MLVCGACQAPNDAGSAFCEDCGSSLTAKCPSCGAAATPGKRFCRSCGASLAPVAEAGPADPPAAAAASTAAPSTERRVCSMLFCDLVGFTPLSELRDPEEVRELLSTYFEAARTIIGRYGGVVEKFIGDAVMAVWGAPVATEEDSERAVRAALDLVDAVSLLGREAGVPGLAARAGVVTGPVAVTLGARGQGLVVGDSVNTAARVQAAADPGTVLVDEKTWRRSQAAIDFTADGSRELKGKAGPVPLWRAERVISGVGGVQRIDGLEAPFVGRDPELRLVKELFHACAERGAPRLVHVSGVPGVGKSRLAWEFEKYVDGLAATVRWHLGRCLSYGDGVAFWALAEMVRQRLDIAEEDPPDVADTKFAEGLRTWVPDHDERRYVGPRLAQLLGVTYGDPGPVLGQDELFAGWRLFFERLAVTPVVMIVEDLHHADAGLLDFLEHLLDWARDAPIFVLTLARPELESIRPGWGTGRRTTTSLALDALDGPAMEDVLDALVPGMPPSARTAISARAEGIPLYAVETVRMLIDRDVVQPRDGVYRLVGDLGELNVPTTLQSLLAARLDALDPEARALVADAAVLGGSFPAEALVAVTSRPEPEVRRLLAELVQREVLGVRADPLSPQRGHYGFLQTMFRQVAYDTLSRRERKSRHLAVAAHLASTFGDEGEEISEVIASHLVDALEAVPDDPDVAELTRRAVTALTRAGDRAVRTGAPLSATRSYTAGADLLASSGPAEADLDAAALLERAGAAATTMGRFDEAVQHFRRAGDLYREHGRTRDAARADLGLAASDRRSGRLEDARPRLRSGLAVLTVEPDADTVTALIELSALEAFSGNAAEADRLSAAAFDEAQALDLTDTVFAGLFATRGMVQGLAGRHEQSAANLREAARRADTQHDSLVAARALLNLADTLTTIDASAAVVAARAAQQHSRRVGHREYLAFSAANLIQGLLLVGDWADARLVHTEAVREDGLGEHHAVAQLGALLFSLLGDRPALAEVVEAVVKAGSDDPQDRGGAEASLAAAAALGGDMTGSLEHAVRALEHGKLLGPHSDAVYWGWPLAADAALAIGDDVRVGWLLEMLDERRPGHVPRLLRAERLRVLARVAARDGRPDAGHAFDAAVHATRQVGSPYHLAVALLDQADHLVATGEREAATALVAEAREIAERLGAEPLLARARHHAHLEHLEDLASRPS